MTVLLLEKATMTTADLDGASTISAGVATGGRRKRIASTYQHPETTAVARKSRTTYEKPPGSAVQYFGSDLVQKGDSGNDSNT